MHKFCNKNIGTKGCENKARYKIVKRCRRLDFVPQFKLNHLQLTPPNLKTKPKSHAFVSHVLRSRPDGQELKKNKRDTLRIKRRRWRNIAPHFKFDLLQLSPQTSAQPNPNPTLHHTPTYYVYGHRLLNIHHRTIKQTGKQNHEKQKHNLIGLTLFIFKFRGNPSLLK